MCVGPSPWTTAKHDPGPRTEHDQGPKDGPRTLNQGPRTTNSAVYSSLSADGIGSRAARMAGSRPPISPITSEYDKPWMSSRGVTVNANATWLNVCKFIVDVW